MDYTRDHSTPGKGFFVVRICFFSQEKGVNRSLVMKRSKKVILDDSQDEQAAGELGGLLLLCRPCPVVQWKEHCQEAVSRTEPQRRLSSITPGVGVYVHQETHVKRWKWDKSNDYKGLGWWYKYQEIWSQVALNLTLSLATN